MPYNFYLGIDVSKASLSVVLMSSDNKVLWSSKKIANQPSGFKQMVEHASKIASKHADGDDYSIAAGMESTGVYGEQLSYYLADNNMSGRISLYVLNPFAVKSYRKATMHLNKNDAADARLIASYLISMITTGQITPWQAPSLAERLLRELTRRRAELVTLREAEYNRLEKFRAGGSHPHPVIESVQELIAHLEQQIREIDEAIEKHIDDAGLRDTAELLRSIDGIGKVSSASFIGEAGDISRYRSVKQLVSRLGIAPCENQSGTSVHKKPVMSRMGSAVLRHAMYMAALVATRKNKVISAFYNRLLARGKCKKLAVIASMRKLLHIIWGVLTHGVKFDPEYAPA